MKHDMQLMGVAGHTTLKWDPKNEDEVKVARDTFDQMTARGYIAFRRDRLGGKGERMTTFDPKAKRMIIFPHIVGG